MSAPSFTVFPVNRLPSRTSFAKPASCRAVVSVNSVRPSLYQSVSASCVQTLCVVYGSTRRLSGAAVICEPTVKLPVSVAFSPLPS